MVVGGRLGEIGSDGIVGKLGVELRSGGVCVCVCFWCVLVVLFFWSSEERC